MEKIEKIKLNGKIFYKVKINENKIIENHYIDNLKIKLSMKSIYEILNNNSDLKNKYLILLNFKKKYSFYYPFKIIYELIILFLNILILVNILDNNYLNDIYKPDNKYFNLNNLNDCLNFNLTYFKYEYKYLCEISNLKYYMIFIRIKYKLFKYTYILFIIVIINFIIKNLLYFTVNINVKIKKYKRIRLKNLIMNILFIWNFSSIILFYYFDYNIANVIVGIIFYIIYFIYFRYSIYKYKYNSLFKQEKNYLLFIVVHSLFWENTLLNKTYVAVFIFKLYIFIIILILYFYYIIKYIRKISNNYNNKLLKIVYYKRLSYSFNIFFIILLIITNILNIFIKINKNANLIFIIISLIFSIVSFLINFLVIFYSIKKSNKISVTLNNNHNNIVFKKYNFRLNFPMKYVRISNEYFKKYKEDTVELNLSNIISKNPTKSENDLNSNNKKDECYICWTNKPNCISNPCNHGKLCLDCQLQNLTINKCCSLCKNNINYVLEVTKEKGFHKVINIYLFIY